MLIKKNESVSDMIECVMDFYTDKWLHDDVRTAAPKSPQQRRNEHGVHQIYAPVGFETSDHHRLHTPWQKIIDPKESMIRNKNHVNRFFNIVAKQILKRVASLLR